MPSKRRVELGGAGFSPADIEIPEGRILYSVLYHKGVSAPEAGTIVKMYGDKYIITGHVRRTKIPEIYLDVYGTAYQRTTTTE